MKLQQRQLADVNKELEALQACIAQASFCCCDPQYDFRLDWKETSAASGGSAQRWLVIGSKWDVVRGRWGAMCGHMSVPGV